MRQYPFTPEEFKSIYSKVPRLCVDLIIMHPDGIILIERQHPSWKGYWHFPGVTVLIGESLIDAVKRAAHEELGLEVDIQKQQGYIEYHSEPQMRGFGYSVSLVFICKTQSPLLSVNEENESVRAWSRMPDKFIDEQRPAMEQALTLWQQLK